MIAGVHTTLAWKSHIFILKFNIILLNLIKCFPTSSEAYLTYPLYFILYFFVLLKPRHVKYLKCYISLLLGTILKHVNLSVDTCSHVKPSGSNWSIFILFSLYNLLKLLHIKTYIVNIKINSKRETKYLSWI